MNYRHHFHAGNFADLVKHATLTQALRQMQRDPAPLLVIDTHAGAGLYELDFKSMREGEAVAAKRLSLDEHAPAVFDALKRAMREESARLQTPIYPGSPLLIARALRRGDALVACELRADDHAALEQRLRRLGGKTEAVRTDGYAEAVTRLQALHGGRALVLIDPSYERGDEYACAVDTVGQVLRANPQAAVLLWAPLKDLETLDRLARDLEALRPTPVGFVAEVRLRPPLDPMRLNGCAVVAINPPAGLEEAAEAAAAWVAARVGEADASSRLWRLSA